MVFFARQFFLGFDGANVSISVAGGVGPLALLVEPLGCDSQGGGPKNTAEAGSQGGAHAGGGVSGGRGRGGGVDCSDLDLVVSLRYLWQRAGEATVDLATGVLAFLPVGFEAPPLTIVQ